MVITFIFNNINLIIIIIIKNWVTKDIPVCANLCLSPVLDHSELDPDPSHFHLLSALKIFNFYFWNFLEFSRILEAFEKKKKDSSSPIMTYPIQIRLKFSNFKLLKSIRPHPSSSITYGRVRSSVVSRFHPIEPSNPVLDTLMVTGKSWFLKYTSQLSTFKPLPADTLK
jgi:hypothetical protein